MNKVPPGVAMGYSKEALEFLLQRHDYDELTDPKMAYHTINSYITSGVLSATVIRTGIVEIRLNALR